MEIQASNKKFGKLLLRTSLGLLQSRELVQAGGCVAHVIADFTFGIAVGCP